jgi:hypothetical protein
MTGFMNLFASNTEVIAASSKAVNAGVPPPHVLPGQSRHFQIVNR